VANLPLSDRAIFHLSRFRRSEPTYLLYIWYDTSQDLCLHNIVTL